MFRFGEVEGDEEELPIEPLEQLVKQEVDDVSLEQDPLYSILDDYINQEAEGAGQFNSGEVKPEVPGPMSGLLSSRTKRKPASPICAQVESQPKKRGRGRPPKLKQVEPKNRLPTASKKEYEPLMGHVIEKVQERGGSEEESSSIPRKRGRPSKKTISEPIRLLSPVPSQGPLNVRNEELDFSVKKKHKHGKSQEGSPTPPRKRGRPSKKTLSETLRFLPLVSSQKTLNVSNEQLDFSFKKKYKHGQSQEGNSIPPQKRGRPSKKTVSEPLPAKGQKTKTYGSREEFETEMDQAVRSIIDEAIHVMKLDPREYHPFYLRIYKYISIGRQFGYISPEKNLISLAIWKKYDEIASSLVKISKTRDSEIYHNPIQTIEESPYAIFIKTGKVIVNGKEVEIKRNEEEVQKMIKEVETRVTEFIKKRKLLKSGRKWKSSRPNLKARLVFFEECKTVTFPADCIRMNHLWRNFTKGFPLKSVGEEGKQAETFALKRLKVIRKGGLRKGKKTRRTHSKIELAICSRKWPSTPKFIRPDGTKNNKVQQPKEKKISPQPVIKSETEPKVSSKTEPKSSISALARFRGDKSSKAEIRKNDDYICAECGAVFAFNYDFRRHMFQKHTGDRVMPCPICGENYRDGRSLWSHFQIDHTLEGTQLQLEEGVKAKNERVPWFRDDKLNAEFNLPSQTTGEVCCEECGKTFDNKSYLERHIFQKHGSGQKLFFCSECPKSFKGKDWMMAHIRQEHLGIDYRCDHCGRKMQSAGKLWKHKVDTHGLVDLEPPEGVVAHRCEFCGESLLRGIMQHMQKNHPRELAEYDRNPNAPAAIKFRSLFDPKIGKQKKIEKKREERRIYKEQGVGPAWLLKEKQKDRMRRTSFPCPNTVCGRRFGSRCKLELHLRENHFDLVGMLKETHILERRDKKFPGGDYFEYYCSICEERLHEREEMICHFLVHHQRILEKIRGESDTFKFTLIPGGGGLNCPYCDATFGWDKDRRDHATSKHPEMCWSCAECSKTSNGPITMLISSEDLKEHYLLQHDEPDLIEEWKKKNQEKPLPAKIRRGKVRTLFPKEGQKPRPRKRRKKNGSSSEDEDDDFN